MDNCIVIEGIAFSRTEYLAVWGHIYGCFIGIYKKGFPDLEIGLLQMITVIENRAASFFTEQEIQEIKDTLNDTGKYVENQLKHFTRKPSTAQEN